MGKSETFVAAAWSSSVKPGDLAVVKCKRAPSLSGKIVLRVEWQKPPAAFQGSRWLCIVDGTVRSIQSGWLKEIK